MNCIRCETEFVPKRIDAKYCSPRCSKLHLKSLYRKRNKDRLQAYARDYRRAKNGGNRSLTYPAKLRESECLNCGTSDDLQLAHVKPLWAGGNHKYVITLCRTHHNRFDNLLREFWQRDTLQP